MNQIIRDVAGYGGLYAVADNGNVYRLLKPSKSQRYPLVSLSKGNVRHTHRVHRLVSETFIGECPVEMEVNHKNGNKNDNALSNLEFVTRKENNTHARDVLKRGYARRAATPMLVVDEIRKLRTNGFSYKQLSEKFGISEITAFRIVKNKTRTRINHR